MSRMFSVEGKVALVTGAAQGLGESMVKLLSEGGARVIACDVNEEGINRTVEQVHAERPDASCEPIKADVADDNDVARLLHHIAAQYGRLDICINNAGVLERGPIEQMSLKAWARVMDVNVTGVFLVSKYAAQLMIDSKQGGSIINMSSMSAQIVNVPMKQTAYNVSKAAVSMLTKSCAVEWAPYGIRVNALAPGYIRTAMTGPDFEAGGQFASLLQWIPLKQLGEPSDLWGAIMWLASDASGYVTGSIVTIDGGYTLI